MALCIHFYPLAVLFLVSWHSVIGYSPSPRLLKRVAHPSTLSLEILPRQIRPFSPTSPYSKRSPPLPSTLRYDDSFRLALSAFDDTFYIHLRPNDHIVHPAARINYYSTDSNGHSYLSHSEPLLRESVKAYWGEVIAAIHSPTRMREDAAGVVHTTHSSVLGWARIMVHHQGDMERGIPPEYEGAFSVKGVIYHIMTKGNYLRTKYELDPDLSQPLEVNASDSSLVIWREADVMTPEEDRIAKRMASSTDSPSNSHDCGHDRLPYNIQNSILHAPLDSRSWVANPPVLLTNGSGQRRDDIIGGSGMNSNFITSIGSTDGCPKSQKLLFMGVAADCIYTSHFSSQKSASQQILTNWNSATALYKTTFNVSLGILELQIQSPTCPTTPDPTIPWNVNCSGAALDTRLSLFSQWRGNKGSDGVGLWHLMSGCPTGSEVGIAWLGTLCQQHASGSGGSVVSGTAVSTSGRTEWQVVAHEIGHNFGAIHDCTDGCNSTSPCCPLSNGGTCNANSQFIMSPIAEASEHVFSPCSLGNICSVMQDASGTRINTTCLVDPANGRETITLKMCGNGIVEEGEDCDPGKGVTSACCDSATCKFVNGAVCDPESSPCCTDQCVFAPSAQVCRPSKDSTCDTAEMCTGNSSACPADVFAPNGQSCGDNGLACASGVCTSVAQQCQKVGASMGLRQACSTQNDISCQISCQDPNRLSQCVILNSLLIDGSPCGYGGTCVSGKCQSGNLFDTAKAWYTQNLQIAIPVTIVAGLVAILILWAIGKGIARCCKSRDPPSTDPALAGVQHQRLESYGRDGTAYPVPAPPFPPATPTFLQPANASYSRVSRENQGYGRGHMNWVDETAYNGRQ